MFILSNGYMLLADVHPNVWSIWRLTDHDVFKNKKSEASVGYIGNFLVYCIKKTMVSNILALFGFNVAGVADRPRRPGSAAA